MKQRQLIVLLVWVLAWHAPDPARAGISLERADVGRYALIVNTQEGPGSGQLAMVLAQQYGFDVRLLEGQEATRDAIDAQMGQLYDVIQPYDQLLVYFSMPVLRSGKTYFLPADGDPEERWRLLPLNYLAEWLNALPTGNALMVYPGCGSRSPYGDPQLEELAYTKRPGPLEVLLACDFEALRTMRRDPEAGFVEWRGNHLAGVLAGVLSSVAMSSSGAAPEAAAIDSPALLDRMYEAGLEAIELLLVPIPLHEQPAFRFAPIFAGNEYADRYAHAPDFGTLLQVQKDYLAASGEGPELQTAFIAFSRSVAVSHRAMAPAETRLSDRETLQLRRNAVSSLTRLGTEIVEARDALNAIAAEAVDSSLIRRAAVSAVTRWAREERPADMEAFRRAMQDADASVREAGVVGLVQGAHQDNAAFLAEALTQENDTRVKRTMIEGLASYSREADRELFQALLVDRDAGVRGVAVAALANLEPDTGTQQAILEVFTSDNDAQVRTASAYAMTETVTPETQEQSVEVLIAALANDSDSVRVAAASSLGILGGAEAEGALRARLGGDGMLQLRITAAEALGTMRSSAAIPELAAASRSEEPALRLAAVAALGRVATSEAADLLWERIETDPEEEVRDAANNAIRSMELEQMSVRSRFYSDSMQVRQAAVTEIARAAGPDATQFLVLGLEDPNEQVQEAAISGLVRSGDLEVVDALLEGLESGSDVLRLNAARVLGLRADTGTGRVLEALAETAASGNPEVRGAAVRALGAIGHERSLGVVLRASEDREPGVRAAAAWALGRLENERAQSRLEMMAKTDRSREVQGAAIEALSARRRF